MPELLLQRLQPRPAAAPRRRRRGPGAALDRAGDAGAGRDGAGPARVPAALGGRGALGVRGLDARPAPLRRGHRPGRGGRARTSRCSCRSSWKAAGTRCRCSPRSKEARVPRTAPVLGLPKDREGVHRGPKPDVASAGRAAWPKLHEEGKVTVFPAVGYDPPDESHFTSRHYWEVGELNTKTRSGWMGRSARRDRRTRQPSAGPVAGLLARAGAGHREVPVAAVSSPADYNLWAYGLDEPLTDPALRTFGALGALDAPSPA